MEKFKYVSPELKFELINVDIITESHFQTDDVFDENGEIPME